MAEPHRDPVVRQLREQITDNDRAIVDAVNRRLALVAKLKDYKLAHGYELVDPAREDWMITFLARANRGPLSSEGLREFYATLLDLTKRELAIEAGARSPAP